MRAPPEQLTMTSGRFERVASSMQRVTVSPTTLPIEPIMKVRSRQQTIASRPLMNIFPELWQRSQRPSGMAARRAGRTSFHVRALSAEARAIGSLTLLRIRKEGLPAQSPAKPVGQPPPTLPDTGRSVAEPAPPDAI